MQSQTMISIKNTKVFDTNVFTQLRYRDKIIIETMNQYTIIIEQMQQNKLFSLEKHRKKNTKQQCFLSRLIVIHSFISLCLLFNTMYQQNVETYLYVTHKLVKAPFDHAESCQGFFLNSLFCCPSIILRTGRDFSDWTGPADTGQLIFPM